MAGSSFYSGLVIGVGIFCVIFLIWFIPKALKEGKEVTAGTLNIAAGVSMDLAAETNNRAAGKVKRQRSKDVTQDVENPDVARFTNPLESKDYDEDVSILRDSSIL
jgi:hypothetical protein